MEDNADPQKLTFSQRHLMAGDNYIMMFSATKACTIDSSLSVSPRNSIALVDSSEYYARMIDNYLAFTPARKILARRRAAMEYRKGVL